MSKLDANSTVAQWVVEKPQTARVFEKLGIDYCCGGSAKVAVACKMKQLDALEVTRQLACAIDESEDASNLDWTQTSLTELCDHIQQTHHAYLREELPRLEAMITKVVNAHGERHPSVHELKATFAELRGELEPHMMKEEQILFPAIRALETGANRPNFPFGPLANPIRMMEHEHDAAGGALKRIRELTADFQAPEDVCNTYRVMLDGLRQLESDLHIHIHKENNILFPRAQQLEESLVTT